MAASESGHGDQDNESTFHQSDARLKAILIEIDDDVQQQLEARFSTSGRGRPPCLPKVRCTHRLFLQIYAIKVRLNASWETVVKWLLQLFPNYPHHRFRALVEGILSKCLKSETREDFYDIAVDLNSVGPCCTGHGLSRLKLRDITSIDVQCDISNRLLLELESFIKVDKLSYEHLFCVIQKLNSEPHFRDTRHLRSELAKIRSEKQKLGKSAAKNPGVLDTFLERKIGSLTIAASATESSANVPSATSTTNNNSNTARENTKNNNNEQFFLLKTRLATYEELCTEKQSVIRKLDSNLQQTNKTVDTLENKITVLKRQLSEKTDQLVGCNAELKNVKGSGRYQKNRRKEMKLAETEASLKSATKVVKNAHLRQLRQQINGLLVQVNNYKLANGVHIGDKQNLKSQVKGLRDQCVKLEAELLGLREGNGVEMRQGFQFTESVEKCVMELMGECEVSSKNVGKVIQAVSKWMFNTSIQSTDLPSASTCVNMMDRAHVLSKYQVAEEISDKDHFDFHSDGTSRDHKQVIGQQINLSSGKTLSLGFSSVAVEDSCTLLDNVISMIDELSSVYENDPIEKEVVSRKILHKMFAVMSDRCSVNKSFNEKLSQYKKNVLGSDVDTHFLFCNAHFLLGLSNMCEKQLKIIESDICKELGHKLGRDVLDKFKYWNSGSESATCRFVRTGCDVLGPRGDAKSGCKHLWEAFLQEKLQKKSKVTSFRMNRFNNFFLGAATLLFHAEEIELFLSDYRENLNLKLESVLADCKCSTLKSLTRALGIIYYKVTGPFWDMLQGGVEYVDQYLYVQQMLDKFRLWARDASLLMAKDDEGIFTDFPPKKDEIFEVLFSDSLDARTKSTLESLMVSFIEVTERQLSDFLPDGKFGRQPDPDFREKMRHSKLTNLLSENEFGDLDFAFFKRRRASLHYHSGIQMVKRNKTISAWLSSKSPVEQSKLLKVAREKGSNLRKKHRENEKAVMVKLKERLEECFERKKAKAAATLKLKADIDNRVREHGGPCRTAADVNRLMKGVKTKTAQTALLKSEVSYLTKVLGVKDRRLVFSKNDFISVLTSLVDRLPPAPPIPSTSTSDSVNESNMSASSTGAVSKNKKIKRTSSKSETESDQASNFDNSDYGEISDIDYSDTEDEIQNFKFTKQGTVAVAYDERYFLGQVIEITDVNKATIQFMRMGYQKTFQWPQVDDIDEVDAHFVFASDFEVLPSGRRGRLWTVPELKKIEKLYLKYQSKYF